MRWLTVLVIVAGCSSASAVDRVDRPQIIAELATRAACIICQKQTKPEPKPTTKCLRCTNGQVKTGDGLAWVPCECGDTCECPKKAEPPKPAAAPAKKPVSKGRIVCENGKCYWLEDGKRYEVIK